MERLYCTYILTNVSHRVLYIGVTGDLPARLEQYRQGKGGEFTKRYKVTKLIWMEVHPTAPDAIAREKQIKGWRRERKIELIDAPNPQWEDLANTLL